MTSGDYDYDYDFKKDEDVDRWRRDFGFDMRYGEHAVTSATRSTRDDKIVEAIAGLIECPRCGAWISDVDLHIDWHTKLGAVG